jgi:shikimate dehydrogenase
VIVTFSLDILSTLLLVTLTGERDATPVLQHNGWMGLTINKDTQLCISLAGRPGNFGTRFHNYLFDELALDYVYKACTTDDLAGAIGGVRALGIRGCSVSMPFKEACIPMLDQLDPSAAVIGSVNTIVNTDGHLHAFNTDYLAIVQLLEAYDVATDSPFAVLGSGGMAKAVVAALRDRGLGSGLVVARNEVRGKDLAGHYGYAWMPSLGTERPSLIINATSIGMAGGPLAGELPCDRQAVEAADTVFEVVAIPLLTPLAHLAIMLGKRVITGSEVSALQASAQFALYTGVQLTSDQTARAAAFARM